MSPISNFAEKQVRRSRSARASKWGISIGDVIALQPEEDNELVTNCHELKMTAAASYKALIE
jgi:hypothetical protein